MRHSMPLATPKGKTSRKMKLLIFSTFLLCVSAKPIFEQIGIEYAIPSQPLVHPHPAVEANARNEALLPRELIKSKDFYDNPAIAAGLANESWFGFKEMQVIDREAEKIPREKIYERVKSAGFLD